MTPTPSAIWRISQAGLLAGKTSLQCLLDLVLPAVCPACRANDVGQAGWLCPQCTKDLLLLVSWPYCPRCGSSVPAGSMARPDGCYACPTVLPRFSQIVRLGKYSGPLRQLIKQIKYRSNDSAARRLAAMLAGAVASQAVGQSIDLVLPIPAHWRRRFSRGFDHSGRLAKALAGRLGVPLGNELSRVRHTPPQAHLSRTRRLENVRNAFKAISPKTIAGATIVLVDDVCTTGATADEASRTLLNAGASRVIVAVIAKADPPKAYEQKEV
jgi:ComF family protein